MKISVATFNSHLSLTISSLNVAVFQSMMFCRMNYRMESCLLLFFFSFFFEGGGMNTNFVLYYKTHQNSKQQKPQSTYCAKIVEKQCVFWSQYLLLIRIILPHWLRTKKDFDPHWGSSSSPSADPIFKSSSPSADPIFKSSSQSADPKKEISRPLNRNSFTSADPTIFRSSVGNLVGKKHHSWSMNVHKRIVYHRIIWVCVLLVSAAPYNMYIHHLWQ